MTFKSISRVSHSHSLVVSRLWRKYLKLLSRINPWCVPYSDFFVVVEYIENEVHGVKTQAEFMKKFEVIPANWYIERIDLEGSTYYTRRNSWMVSRIIKCMRRCLTFAYLPKAEFFFYLCKKMPCYCKKTNPERSLTIKFHCWDKIQLKFLLGHASKLLMQFYLRHQVHGRVIRCQAKPKRN